MKRADSTRPSRSLVRDSASLTFRLPGFEPLKDPIKVAKLLSCITCQLYTKFMSEVEPIYRLSGSLNVKRMPFGLTNAPTTFQRLIDALFGPEMEPHVFGYLEDIL